MSRAKTVTYKKPYPFPQDINYPFRKQKLLHSPLKTQKRAFISDITSKLEHTLSISLISQELTDIPVELVDVLKAVEQSRYILELEDDWDGEGSSRYQPSVWERAVIFLIELSEKALEAFNTILDAPHIYQGHEGSIDMLWQTDRYQLLVNFPEDVNSRASFYGDNFNMDTVEGTFDPMKGSCSLLAYLVWAKKCIR